MTLVFLAGSIVLMLLALYAQAKVQGNFRKYAEVRPSSGLSGAEAADEMLRRAGVRGVRIEETQGFLSDHYDPRDRVIRLSPDVYRGVSLSALGVACHEAGHALQHAQAYAPLALRNVAVPVASFGSGAGVFIIIGGLMLNMMGLAVIGFVLYCAVVAFQLVNLVVEYDATARAKKALVATGMIAPGREAVGVDHVLDAAALTYLAATIASIWELVRFAWLIFGQRQQQ